MLVAEVSNRCDSEWHFGVLRVLDVWLLLMIVCVGCGLWLCVG